MNVTPRVFLGLCLVLFIGSPLAALRGSVRERAPRPVAVVFLPVPNQLLVANECGSVSVHSPDSLIKQSEVWIGKKLSDLLLLEDGIHLVALDEADSQAILLSAKSGKLRVLDRIALPRSPVRAEEKDGCVFVSSLWGRALSRIPFRYEGEKSLSWRKEKVQTVRLSFSPREVCSIPGRSLLIVADGFGGNVACIRSVDLELLSLHQIRAHNIQGLGVAQNGQRVLLSHQILNPLARTTFDDIHWGELVSNVIRELQVESLVKQDGNPLQRGRVIQLGEVGRGAADPGPLLRLSSGKTLVALSGGGGLCITDPEGSKEERIPVGVGPMALGLGRSKNGSCVFVVSKLLDTLSRVDLETRRVATVDLVDRIGRVGGGGGEPLTLAKRGERLFYDGSLSHDGWMSCHSCHTDGHTAGLLSDTLGDGTFGTPKRILSLLGVSDTAPYGWNGSLPTLEDQVEKSLATTMHLEGGPEGVAQALASFLKNLPPPPPLSSRRKENEAEWERGHDLFQSSGCMKCHRGPEWTSPLTYDVNLRDEKGLSTFNPPSLRGVGHRNRLLHDGRASSIEEVLGRLNHPGTEEFSKAQIRDLGVFLRSLGGKKSI